MSRHFSPRDLAFCGLFGAAALLLPAIFHVVHLGSVFMPMYVPLVALAFFVGPWPAALTALIVPLMSGVATGMPPLYPPVAVCMAIELAAMAALISLAMIRWPRANESLVLLPVLVLGRALNFGLAYASALLIALPPSFVAGLSFLSGWPGVVLMAVAVPAVARAGRARRLQSIERGG
jgi:hypothetical protein